MVNAIMVDSDALIFNLLGSSYYEIMAYCMRALTLLLYFPWARLTSPAVAQYFVMVYSPVLVFMIFIEI